MSWEVVMAPKYVMRVIREPMPGMAFEVLEKVLEFRRAGGIQGMTTAGVFSARQLIVSTTPFESLSEAESLVDGLLSNPQRQQAFADIGALCTSTANNLSRIIEPGSGRETANWIQRYVFTHAPSERRQLIEALREYGSHLGDPKISITGSMNGPQVVSSLAVESLSTIEGRGEAIANDPATTARASAVISHTETYAVGIAKVYRT